LRLPTSYLVTELNNYTLRLAKSGYVADVMLIGELLNYSCWSGSPFSLDHESLTFQSVKRVDQKISTLRAKYSIEIRHNHPAHTHVNDRTIKPSWSRNLLVRGSLTCKNNSIHRLLSGTF